MFAAVKITPLKSRSRFFPPRPQISFTPVLYKGKPLYYLVEMKASREKPGWDLLQRLCISYRSRLLLPVHCNIPESIRLFSYKKTTSEIILLYNTMLRYIKEQSISSQTLSLCLCDENAVIADKITSAVPCFSKINIVTNNSHPYNDVSEYIMKNHGLCLTFSHRPLYTDENTLLVCREAEHIPLNFKGTVFCNESIPAPDCTAVKGSKILMPDELSSVIPTDINPLHFLSAVHEFSDSELLWDISFTS